MKRRVGRILKAALLAIVVLVVLVAVRYGSEPRYLGANLLWDALDIPGWWDREVRLPFKEIPSSTPDRSDQVTDQHDIMIPMRDGVRLSADVYLPEGEGPFPVILVRLPYGKEEAYTYMPAIGRFWAHKGYAFVVQDVRGKFESEGTFVPFIHEVDDGYDTLEWISQQPWSDGNVGMMGESYYGYTTWAGAVSRHPALRAVAVSTISMDVYRTTFRNGALALQTMGDYAILMDNPTYQNDFRVDWWHLPLETLASDAGLSDGLYQMLVDNPVRNAVWDERNLSQHYADIDIPVLAFGGWYDVFLVGTLADWQGIRESRSGAAAGEQWLILGPWDHEYTPEATHRVGRIELGDDPFNRWDEMQRFFDRWLMGVENGFEETPPVQYLTIGANAWHSADQWPPAETTYRQFYFHSGGVLTGTPPAGDEPADEYTYDPMDPVDIAVDEMGWMLAETLQDRARLAERPDVLVYETAPLEAEVEITGPISVTLFAASSAPDTDFTAALVDVFPDGYAHLIQEGIIRASYRNSEREPSPIEPERVYEYSIDLWATSYVVNAGHRIRVEISSSNFNFYDRNPNTGEPFGTATTPVPAQQRVLHTSQYPSRITLPILVR